MSLQLAFVGLGPVGQAMSKRLVDYGELEKPLLLFNRTHHVAENHARSIGHAASVGTLSELVERSDIIWSCLADDAAVREIYSTVLDKGAVDGKLFVECSTISPETTEETGHKLRQAQAQFISMPVFGEPATAAAGQLIVVPAGPATCLDRIRPFLIGVYAKLQYILARPHANEPYSTASAIVDFPDESPSKANILKLIGNVLIMTTMEQVAELLVFAEKADLGTTAIEKLLSALYPGGPRQHEKYASLMASGEYHRRKAIVGTNSAINLSEKIMTLAKSLNVQLNAYEVAIQHLKEAREVAGPDSDIIGIYGAVRQASGLDFEA